MVGHASNVTSRREDADTGKIKTRNAIFAMNGVMCADSLDEFTDMLKLFEVHGIDQSYYSISGAGTRSREMGQVLLKSHQKIFDAAPKFTDFKDGDAFVAAVDAFLEGPGKVFGEEIPISGGRKK